MQPLKWNCFWCIPTGTVPECKEIFRNNENTDGEQYIGHVTSAEECIQLVQANCDWANIANVHEDVFANDSADCWCQKGDNFAPDDTSEYLNCWFGDDLTIDPYPSPTAEPSFNPTTAPSIWIPTLDPTPRPSDEPSAVPTEIPITTTQTSSTPQTTTGMLSHRI